MVTFIEPSERNSMRGTQWEELNEKNSPLAFFKRVCLLTSSRWNLNRLMSFGALENHMVSYAGWPQVRAGPSGLNHDHISNGPRFKLQSDHSHRINHWPQVRLVYRFERWAFKRSNAWNASCWWPWSVASGEAAHRPNTCPQLTVNSFNYTLISLIKIYLV